MLDIQEIYRILPQRFPFVMLDRVTHLEPGEKITAIKNVSINEEYFTGHFPSNPVMPGVLIIEAMAQASIILFHSSPKNTQNKNMVYYLGSVRVRFLHPVIPGDQLEITVEPIKVLANIGIVKARAKVGDKPVAEGEISFAAK